MHVDKELFGDTFRSPPRLTPLEARAIRLALEFVGPMIAADAHTPLERVRRKLEETFGEFDARPDGRAQVGPSRGEARRNAQRRHPPAAARRDRVPEGGRGDALDARSSSRTSSSGSCPTGTSTRGIARATLSGPSGSTACAARSSSARGFEPREGFRARPAERAARRRAHLVLARRSRAGRSRRARSRCPTARRSRRRRSAARSGSSARSSPTAARPCCSSRRTSASRSPGGRSRWHASCRSAPKQARRRGRPKREAG